MENLDNTLLIFPDEPILNIIEYLGDGSLFSFRLTFQKLFMMLRKTKLPRELDEESQKM
jgi:hypothetical protein